MKTVLCLLAAFSTLVLVGCGSDVRTDNAACQAMLDKAAVCEPDAVFSDADIAECEQEFAAIEPTCADAMVALANCQTENEECSDDEPGAACMDQVMAFAENCGR